MPCYAPLKGYRAREVNPSGKRGIVFKAQNGYTDMPVEVPCGQCIGCRLERSRQWAMRCMHEASLYEENCFLTLTYDDDHLPDDYGLCKSAFPEFIRRLRKRYPERKIRYYACGEYGPKTLRPHYHALLFNYDFGDKLQWCPGSSGEMQFVSPELAELWPDGLCTIGTVTFESAAYVARYIMKKQNGENAEKAYKRVDPQTGEEWSVIPEFTTMSRRPGIGRDWYEKYRGDVYPSDFLIVNNAKVRPPKYYDNQYEDIENIKRKRVAEAKKHASNNTAERLLVREAVQQAKLDQLKRNLD